MKKISVAARTENFDAVLAFVEGELEESGYSMKLQRQIAIAVEEIFVNIAYYAYINEAGSVSIRMSVSDEVVIQFEDNGIPFNPLERDAPDITTNAEERQVGGLGIFMIKKLTDTAEYRREGGKNILVIKKRKTGEKE